MSETENTDPFEQNENLQGNPNTSPPPIQNPLPTEAPPVPVPVVQPSAQNANTLPPAENPQQNGTFNAQQNMGTPPTLPAEAPYLGQPQAGNIGGQSQAQPPIQQMGVPPSMPYFYRPSRPYTKQQTMSNVLLLVIGALAFLLSIPSVQFPSFLFFVVLVTYLCVYISYPRNFSVVRDDTAEAHSPKIWIFSLIITIVYVFGYHYDPIVNLLFFSLVIISSFTVGKDLVKDKVLLFIVGASLFAINILSLFFPYHSLTIFNRFLNPILATLFMQLCSGATDSLPQRVFYGFTTGLFSSTDKPLMPSKKERSANVKKNYSSIIISVFVSVVALAIIVPLLLSSDEVFRYYFTEFFKHILSREIVLYLAIIPPVLMITYSALWNIRHQRYTPAFMPRGKRIDRWDNVVSSIVLTVLLIVYASYIFIQVKFLFFGNGVLPSGHSFASYARSGFFELCTVIAINILIVISVNTYSTPNRMTKILLHLFLLCSSVMLISAFSRLSTYVDEYGFTWKRLLSLWFLVFVFAMIVITALWTEKPSFRFYRWSFVAFLLWYLSLSALNPAAFIENYNSKYHYDIEDSDVRRKIITETSPIKHSVNLEQDDYKIGELVFTCLPAKS